MGISYFARNKKFPYTIQSGANLNKPAFIFWYLVFGIGGKFSSNISQHAVNDYRWRKRSFHLIKMCPPLHCSSNPRKPIPLQSFFFDSLVSHQFIVLKVEPKRKASNIIFQFLLLLFLSTRTKRQQKITKICLNSMYTTKITRDFILLIKNIRRCFFQGLLTKMAPHPNSCQCLECYSIQLSHMPPLNTRGAYFESLVSG